MGAAGEECGLEKTNRSLHRPRRWRKTHTERLRDREKDWWRSPRKQRNNSASKSPSECPSFCIRLWVVWEITGESILHHKMRVKMQITRCCASGGSVALLQGKITQQDFVTHNYFSQLIITSTYLPYALFWQIQVVEEGKPAHYYRGIKP